MSQLLCNVRAMSMIMATYIGNLLHGIYGTEFAIAISVPFHFPWAPLLPVFRGPNFQRQKRRYKTAIAGTTKQLPVITTTSAHVETHARDFVRCSGLYHTAFFFGWLKCQPSLVWAIITPSPLAIYGHGLWICCHGFASYSQPSRPTQESCALKNRPCYRRDLFRLLCIELPYPCLDSPIARDLSQDFF